MREELIGFLFLSEKASWDEIQKAAIKHGLFMFVDKGGETILLSEIFLPRFRKRWREDD